MTPIDERAVYWYVPGVWPKLRRNTSMKALAEAQPHRWATVVTGVFSASKIRAWYRRSGVGQVVGLLGRGP